MVIHSIAISTNNEVYYYGITYLLAFCVAGAVLAFSGFRKKIPRTKWLIILLLFAFCAIVGDKLFTFTPGEWKQFLHDFQLPDTGKKSVLGAILGCISGFLILRIILRYPVQLSDQLAYIFPAMIAISRIGCLFAGCCHGTPSTLPWAINYETDYGPNPVSFHPTQVYDIFFCILTILLVWLTRKYWKQSGSNFIFAILCYIGFRFLEEFFREPASGSFFSQNYNGLKNIQWILISGIILLTAILTFRERSKVHIKQRSVMIREHSAREFGLLLAMLIFFLLNFKWFDDFETLTLILFFLPAVISTLLDLYYRITIKGFRTVLGMVIISALIFMSQDTITHQSDSLTAKNWGWLSFSASYGGGRYAIIQRDCEGDEIDRYYRKFVPISWGVAYHYKPRITHHLVVGIDGLLYDDESNNEGKLEYYEIDYRSYGIYPYVRYESKYFGGGLGFVTFFDEVPINHIFPTFYFRGGRQDKVFGEFRIFHDYYISGMAGIFQASLGVGLKKMQESYLRFGLVSVSPDDNIGFLTSGDFLIARDVTIRGSFYISRAAGGSIGLEWHVGRGRWKSPSNLNYLKK